MQPTCVTETSTTEVTEIKEPAVESPERCTVGMDCIWYDSLGD